MLRLLPHCMRIKKTKYTTGTEILGGALAGTYFYPKQQKQPEIPRAINDVKEQTPPFLLPSDLLSLTLMQLAHCSKMTINQFVLWGLYTCQSPVNL
jgi:hypothetical protein